MLPRLRRLVGIDMIMRLTSSWEITFSSNVSDFGRFGAETYC